MAEERFENGQVPIDMENLSMTSEDVRIMENVMEDMDMTTEMPPMSVVFAAPPDPAPAAPPPTAPAAPPPTAPPAPTPPTPPTAAPAAPPAAPAPPPTTTTPPNSPPKKGKKSLKLRRKRKREEEEEEDEQPRPTPPLNSPTQHTTINCTSGVFRDEIAKYVEYARPGWNEYFTNGVMQFMLMTAYRYAADHGREKFVQWKKSRYDTSEMFNVTALCSVEHARSFTNHAMKVILLHASLRACHTSDAPHMSRSTLEMVKQVIKFDYTVDVIGLAMMMDEVEEISTSNFLQLRHGVMMSCGEEDCDMDNSFPFKFEVDKYAFRHFY